MFPEKSKTQVRREQLVLAEIQRVCPFLPPPVGWDCAASDCTLKKPDMWWLFPMQNNNSVAEKQHYLLHLEIDEEKNHEQDDGRLAEIQAMCNNGKGASFATVIRIGLDQRDEDEGPVFKKKRRSDGSIEYHGDTLEFRDRINKTREMVEAVLGLIMKNDTSLTGVFHI
jgi:hypothetical protein